MALAKTRQFEDILPTDQATLEEWYVQYYPAGSGPLQSMRVICAALEEIAAARGYDTDFVKLRAPYRRRS